MTSLFDGQERINILTGGYLQCKIIENENKTISIEFTSYISKPGRIGLKNFFKTYNFNECTIKEFKSDIEEYCYNDKMSTEETDKIIDAILRIFRKCNIKLIKF